MPLLGDLAANACNTRKDYLHQTPDESKYRSTFHSMRNPDTVKDDVAFRALRKDSNIYNDPESLGVYKDPNIPSNISSCWKHQIDESVSSCSKGGRKSPTVFYPNRNNKVMQSLSQNAVMQIKKQSVQAGAGDPDSIITYEDLLNDPDLMEAIRYNLGISGKSDTGTSDEIDSNGDPTIEKSAWKGKTLYELFHENQIILRKVTKENDDNAINNMTGVESSIAQTHNGQNEDIVVQICMIDHNLPFEGLKDNWRIVRKKEDGKVSYKTEESSKCLKSTKNMLSSSVVEELEPSSSSAMRALEREDSSSTEDKNTTVVHVPRKENKNCDKNENFDNTICDGEFESLDNAVSILPDVDTNITNPNEDNDRLALVGNGNIGDEQGKHCPLEAPLTPSTSDRPVQQDENCNGKSGAVLNLDDSLSSEGEQSGDGTINTQIVDHNSFNIAHPGQHFDGCSDTALHKSPSCPTKVTNHRSQTCIESSNFQHPTSQNIIVAQKGELREQTNLGVGDNHDVVFGSNSNLKNFLPKRKISSVGELIEEVHPIVIVLCYLLACLANHTGTDFVTVLGILLTLISMVSMVFI